MMLHKAYLLLTTVMSIIVSALVLATIWLFQKVLPGRLSFALRIWCLSRSEKSWLSAEPGYVRFPILLII